MSIKRIRTRFAPSPTGFLHIGGLRTAAYAYALAKNQGGDFILRLEDTDKKREIEGSAEKLYEVLKTFGLIWDEGPLVGGQYAPYIQSERVALGEYQKAAEKLLADGHAFYCFCKPKTKDEIKEERQYKIEFRDPCRQLTESEISQKINNGEKPAIRLKSPDNETISYTDYVLGKTTTWMTNVVDDAMLLKSDGFPTYHLAVVVDDVAMNITHVLRGHDWQPSTPIHLLVYKYLGLPTPQIGHLTDILNPDGKGKLSKRNNNVSCEQYLTDGYLPEALLNFVILLGWAPKDNQELFTLAEFVKKFEAKGFQKSNPRFDQRKLDWLNGQYLRRKTDQEIYLLSKNLFPENLNEDVIKKIIPLAKERLTKISDIPALTGFIYNDISPDPALLNKDFTSKTIEALQDTDWSKEAIEKALSDVAEKNNFQRGDFFMNLRLTVAGQKVTPPLTECMIIIGKDKVLNRLKDALE